LYVRWHGGVIVQLVFGRMAEASEIAASKGMKNRVNSVFELTLIFAKLFINFERWCLPLKSP